MTNPNHPGHDAAACPLRVSVNAYPNGTSSNGYACGWTGAHCLPGFKCAARVAASAEQEAQEAIFAAQAGAEILQRYS